MNGLVRILGVGSKGVKPDPYFNSLPFFLPLAEAQEHKSEIRISKSETNLNDQN